jgi:hypothetical protein
MATAEAGLIGLLALTTLGGSGTDDCDAIAAGPAGSVFLACHSDSSGFPAGTKGLRDRGQRGRRGVPGGHHGIRRLPHHGGSLPAPLRGRRPGCLRREARSEGIGPLRDAPGRRRRRLRSGRGARRGGLRVRRGRHRLADFPITPSAWQRKSSGESDAFVTKLAPDGTVVFSSYLGGSGGDTAHGVAVSADGVYVAGGTDSRDFPAAGTLPLRAGGGSDAFLAKLDLAGARLLLAGAFGGQRSETARAVAVDAAASVTLAGMTASSDFPVTKGAAQATTGGGDDAFVLKIEGTTPSGFAHVAGWTDSPDLRTAAPIQAGHRGGRDGLLAGLDPRGALEYASYLGGRGADLLEGIVIAADGSVHAAGLTGSPDLRTVGPHPSRFRGGPAEVPYDILLARITPPPPPGSSASRSPRSGRPPRRPAS